MIHTHFFKCMRRWGRHACLLAVSAVLAAGCAGQSARQKNQEEALAQIRAKQAAATARMREEKAAVYTNPGSLWADNGQLTSMFVNPKAHAVGDIVTIKIMEEATASNKATTSTGRKSSMDAGVTNFFNLEQSYPATRSFFNPFGKVAGSIDSSFDGSGSTARSGALNAYMTAQVVEVLPNGNMVIVGNREVLVNHENQVITLSGVIRPRDITADNVVQSTYVADARITYSGSGVLNDRQKPGWLTRILDTVWPF